MTHLPFDRVWSPHIGAGGYPWRWRKPAVARVGFDLFADGVEDEFVDCVFGVMALAPQHTFQVLTKRPERMRRYMENELPMRWLRTDSWNRAAQTIDAARCFDVGCGAFTNPLPNVWLGTSVEDQRAAAERIPLLLQTPAAVRFLSLEPLLGPVDLLRVDAAGFGGAPGHRIDVMRKGYWDDRIGFVNHGDMHDRFGPLHLVIVGGESGPKARPCSLEWIRSIVQQCKDAGVACWVKQLGARCVTQHPMDPGALLPVRFRDRKGADMAEWPQDLRVRHMPEVTR